jgi:hypothetical protein
VLIIPAQRAAENAKARASFFKGEETRTLAQEGTPGVSSDRVCAFRKTGPALSPTVRVSLLGA